MSRKNRAPKRIFYPDSQYGSAILSKFITFKDFDNRWLIKAEPKYPDPPVTIQFII